jgi:pimeloyl-ACP methyl ester carboxylesterase
MFWLHGTPGSRYLRHPGDGYERNHLRVYTYDRPGYGLSTRVPGRRVVDAADDVRAIADAFELRQFGVAGVSGGGPSALAVAALLPDRVSRCAVVVGVAPLRAEGLDFYAGMDVETQQEWEHAVRGEAAMEPAGQAMLDWVEVGLPELDVPDDDRAMLIETMQEAVRQGSVGFVDDYLSLVHDWGISLADVHAPTRAMVAREDTSVPPGHGEWLVEHLPNAELISVDGGHLGPRHEPEMQLMTWVGQGTESPTTVGAT